LSMAKYYTTNPTGIRVDKVFTGGGAYDGLEAFKAYARIEKNDYMAIRGSSSAWTTTTNWDWITAKFLPTEWKIR